MSPQCVIVVPCYNEAHRLPVREFHRFLSTTSDTSFIFVNDGSKDATLDTLTALRQGYEDTIEVLDRPVNAGKGEAVRVGLLRALENSSASFVGFWDADLATPLDTIPELLGILLERAEIQMVFGARVKLLGRNIERRAVRHYLGRLFATAVSVALRLPIYDTQCGAKLFRASPELREILKEPFGSRWVFDVEILARFIRLRNRDMQSVMCAIYEFPLRAWKDIAGSKVRPRDFFRAFRDVVRIYFRYIA
ncbi:MAG TPA: glycosyltransferase [Bryobacteraceae bacterium]|jgi:glycosyltransferase involved in cell wall biosynthesis|nr:glycosyltransferase [Bryobacteraceae bacterium]